MSTDETRCSLCELFYDHELYVLTFDYHSPLNEEILSLSLSLGHLRARRTSMRIRQMPPLRTGAPRRGRRFRRATGAMYARRPGLVNAGWNEEDWPANTAPTEPSSARNDQPVSIFDLIGRAIRERISHGLPIFNEEPSQRRHVLQLPPDGTMAVFGEARVLATTGGISDHPFEFVAPGPSPMQHELRMAGRVSPDAAILEILDDDMEAPNNDKTPPGGGPRTPPGSPLHSPTCTPRHVALRTPPNVDTDETVWSGDDDDLWCTIDEWEGESQQF